MKLFLEDDQWTWVEILADQSSKTFERYRLQAKAVAQVSRIYEPVTIGETFTVEKRQDGRCGAFGGWTLVDVATARERYCVSPPVIEEGST